MKSYVVDTHAVVWYLTDDARLGKKARQILETDSNQLILPAIVLAEARYIAERKRVPISFPDILAAITTDPRCIVYPIDILTVFYLPEGLNIHDSLILVTALLCRDLLKQEIHILTKDEAIKESGLIPTVW